MKIVRLLGSSKILEAMPPTPPGVEAWACNDARKYGASQKRVQREYTRWFNLHSRHWVQTQYPSMLAWHRGQRRPLYTQRVWTGIPPSRAFPRKTLQRAFATARGANRYFTCTIAWCMALAIHERFERIKCWGVQFADRPGFAEFYASQRPCFFYWVQVARARGIEVAYQAPVAALPFLPGDPDAYDGPLYGYGTRPEVPGWVIESRKRHGWKPERAWSTPYVPALERARLLRG